MIEIYYMQKKKNDAFMNYKTSEINLNTLKGSLIIIYFFIY